MKLRVWLSYAGHELTYGTFGFEVVDWARKQSFFTQTALPAQLPAGTYRACKKAWDRAGNAAQDCAPYHVRQRRSGPSGAGPTVPA